MSFNANDVVLDAPSAAGDAPTGDLQKAGKKDCSVSSVDCAPASFADSSVGAQAAHRMHHCDAGGILFVGHPVGR